MRVLQTIQISKLKSGSEEPIETSKRVQHQERPKGKERKRQMETGTLQRTVLLEVLRIF